MKQERRIYKINSHILRNKLITAHVYKRYIYLLFSVPYLVSLFVFCFLNRWSLHLLFSNNLYIIWVTILECWRQKVKKYIKGDYLLSRYVINKTKAKISFLIFKLRSIFNFILKFCLLIILSLMFHI